MKLGQCSRPVRNREPQAVRRPWIQVGLSRFTRGRKRSGGFLTEIPDLRTAQVAGLFRWAGQGTLPTEKPDYDASPCRS